jgi:hypothetical protein
MEKCIIINICLCTQISITLLVFYTFHIYVKHYVVIMRGNNPFYIFSFIMLDLELLPIFMFLNGIL